MKCRHIDSYMVEGTWGPHRAKRVCWDCGMHVKWEKAQQNPYYKRTGRKYVYGSNTGTANKPITHSQNSSSHVQMGI